MPENNPPNHDLRRRQLARLDRAGREDVQHGNAVGQQVVTQHVPVAVPLVALGTQDRGAVVPRDLDQPRTGPTKMSLTKPVWQKN